MVIFEGVLILRFLVKLFVWALILRKLKKAKLKFYVFSFILSNSNKGIKHSEDFDKKKCKREYLGRIIDNVDFFHEQSRVHFIFINSHVWIFFSSTVSWLFLIGNNTNVISMWYSLSVTCGRSVVFAGNSGFLHQ